MEYFPKIFFCFRCASVLLPFCFRYAGKVMTFQGFRKCPCPLESIFVFGFFCSLSCTFFQNCFPDCFWISAALLFTFEIIFVTFRVFELTLPIWKYTMPWSEISQKQSFRKDAQLQPLSETCPSMFKCTSPAHRRRKRKKKKRHSHKHWGVNIEGQFSLNGALFWTMKIKNCVLQVSQKRDKLISQGSIWIVRSIFAPILSYIWIVRSIFAPILEICGKLIFHISS